MSKMFTFDTVDILRSLIMSFCSTTYFQYIAVGSPVVQWVERYSFFSTADHGVGGSSPGGKFFNNKKVLIKVVDMVILSNYWSLVTSQKSLKTLWTWVLNLQKPPFWSRFESHRVKNIFFCSIVPWGKWGVTPPPTQKYHPKHCQNPPTWVQNLQKPHF